MYIGTLKLEYRGFLENWQVKDEYDDMVKPFRERYPQMNQDIVKSLMKLEYNIEVRSIRAVFR